MSEPSGGGAAPLAEAARLSGRPAGLDLPLETPRLWLREFGADDLAAMLAYGTDKRVTRYMLFAPDSEESARRHLGAIVRQQRAADRNAWELAAVSRANGCIVGACDLTLAGHREGDLGYVLAHKHWGQGYATEIVGAMLAASFDQLRLERVVCTVDVRNQRSMRVLEKAGLRWEGTLRRHVQARGRWWDVEVYALSREEWLQRRNEV